MYAHFSVFQYVHRIQKSEDEAVIMERPEGGATGETNQIKDGVVLEGAQASSAVLLLRLITCCPTPAKCIVPLLRLMKTIVLKR